MSEQTEGRWTVDDDHDLKWERPHHASHGDAIWFSYTKEFKATLSPDSMAALVELVRQQDEPSMVELLTEELAIEVAARPPAKPPVWVRHETGWELLLADSGEWLAVDRDGVPGGFVTLAAAAKWARGEHE